MVCSRIESCAPTSREPISSGPGTSSSRSVRVADWSASRQNYSESPRNVQFRRPARSGLFLFASTTGSMLVVETLRTIPLFSQCRDNELEQLGDAFIRSEEHTSELQSR